MSTLRLAFSLLALSLAAAPIACSSSSPSSGDGNGQADVASAPADDRAAPGDDRAAPADDTAAPGDDRASSDDERAEGPFAALDVTELTRELALDAVQAAKLVEFQAHRALQPHGGKHGGKRRGGHGLEQRVRRMTEALNLSPAQQEKFRALLRAQRAQRAQRGRPQGPPQGPPQGTPQGV